MDQITHDVRTAQSVSLNKPVPEERLKLGFSEYDNLNDNNIINDYKSDEDRNRANDVFYSADLILAGYTSEKINISNPNAIVFLQ